MNNEKKEILFSYPEVELCSVDLWPDYLQHGFDQDDIPDLIELLTDKKLHNADYQSNEAMIPGESSGNYNLPKQFYH